MGVLLSQYTKQNPQKQERLISIWRFIDKIWNLTWNADEYFVDLLIEQNGFTVLVFDNESNLYARTVTISGDDVSLGERVRVTESYEILADGTNTSSEDVSEDTENRMVRFRGTMQVHRQKDGTYRWLMRAAIAVLNRVLELDSTALFDEFVNRFKSGDFPIPYLTLRHQPKDGFYMGDVDYVGRDGFVLVASGTFDDDPENILAQKAALSISQDTEGFWGVSIGFQLEQDDPMPETLRQVIRMEQGDVILEIPVYNKGTLVECSILDETECASFFTDVVSMEVLDAMPKELRNRNDRKELLKLFGTDEAVDEFLEGNDELNRDITERGLITRDTELDEIADELDSQTDVLETDDDAQETDDETDDEITDDESIEIDDDLFADLISGLMSNDDFVSMVADAVSSENRNLRIPVARNIMDITALNRRLEIAESALEELGANLEDDMPQRSRRKILSGKKRGKRPRDLHSSEQDDEPDDSLDSILDDMLVEIPD